MLSNSDTTPSAPTADDNNSAELQYFVRDDLAYQSTSYSLKLPFSVYEVACGQLTLMKRSLGSPKVITDHSVIKG
jgi:hypothetical protein